MIFETGTAWWYRTQESIISQVNFSPVLDTCENIDCGGGKKCILRKGSPKCVCAPNCKQRGRHMRNPVCGTDGRNYRTLCRLKKRACRKNEAIAVDYTGLCQSKFIVVVASTSLGDLLKQIIPRTVITYITYVSSMRRLFTHFSHV